MSDHCERYEAEISAWLDGELTDREAEELRNHLRSCGQCRAFMTDLAGLSDGLKEDLPDPPASLLPGVMDRILAEEETGTDAGTTVDLSRVRRASRRRGGRVLAAAACLALVLGGAWFGLNRSRSLHTAPAAESITLEAAGAPVPQPEEAPEMDGAAVSEDEDTVLFAQNAVDMPEEEAITGAAEEALTEAAEEPAAYQEDRSEELPLAAADAEGVVVMEGSSQRPVTASHAPPVSTWEDPSRVQEGREADFEALIAAVPWPEGIAAEDLSLIAAVDYSGVIYEFLTDPGGTVLFWRDAAESVDPIPAAGTPEELWDILG